MFVSPGSRIPKGTPIAQPPSDLRAIDALTWLMTPFGRILEPKSSHQSWSAGSYNPGFDLEQWWLWQSLSVDPYSHSDRCVPLVRMSDGKQAYWKLDEIKSGSKFGRIRLVSPHPKIAEDRFIVMVARSDANGLFVLREGEQTMDYMLL